MNQMTNLQTVIKVLKILNEDFGNEDFDNDVISPDAIGIPKGKWEQLLIEMQHSGLIRGLNVVKAMGEAFEHIRGEAFPIITIDGMEYLAACMNSHEKR